MATSELFARVSETPAVRSLARRLENGGVLSCAAVTQAAQPFLAVLLRRLFPNRPVIVVTDNLKTQESFHLDAATWLDALSRESRVERRGPADKSSRPSTLDPRPVVYPAWDVLPHEGKLPHADTISDRLETLVALTNQSGIPNSQSATVVT